MSVFTLFNPEERLFGRQDHVMRGGIELEKGVVITQEWLERNEELLFDCWNTYSAYPDIYLDMIKPAESNFDLFPYFPSSQLPHFFIQINFCRQPSEPVIKDMIAGHGKT